MLKRGFAFLLAFLMLFSSVPVEAVAAMIQEEPAEETLVVTSSDETSAPVETTSDAPAPMSETVIETTVVETVVGVAVAETVPVTTVTETTAAQPVPETTVVETTAAETVPETTVEETVVETTAAETVPETTVEETVVETTAAETVPETTVEETVVETTAAETVPETTVTETVPETTAAETVEETVEAEVNKEPAMAVTEPAMTGYWNQDAYALVKAYYEGGYEQAEDGSTVFGTYYGEPTAEKWNTYFAAYCLEKAGINTDYFPVVQTSAAAWKNALEEAGFYPKSGDPKNGDLLFYHPYEDSNDIRVGFFHDWKLLTADDTVTHDNALHGKEGGIATFDTWRCQVIGYVSIPDMDRAAKVFTDSTWQTAAIDSGISGIVEGSVPAGTQIRICPIALTEDQQTEINTLGHLLNAYRVAHYINDTQADGSTSFTIKFKSNDFVPPKAVKVYKLENGEATSEIKCTALDGGISFKASGVVDFVIVSDDREVTVTTAEELAAAVQSGMPKITLGADLSASNTLTINQVVEIDLNGHTLTAEGSQPLFDVRGVLTVDDSGSETVSKSDGTKLGRPDEVSDAALGSVAKAENGKAVLTYYTTKSVDKYPDWVVDNGATDEYRYQHTVTAAGMVENKSSQPLFVVNGGTLNISGGMLVGNLNGGYSGRGIVQNSGTTNLTGGYLAGFNVKPNRTDWSDLNDFGGAIRANGGSLNIGEAVIAANQAISGAGIYAANTTVTLENGVISGNKATGASDAAINNNNGPHFGGAGVYLGEHSSITVNGANSYITNNSAPNANGYADGGGAIFARLWTTITINNGYITSNTVGGGGGAIRTIYGQEKDYANMESDAVKSQVQMSVFLNGGYICGNLCRYAEGGGVSINAGTGCWFTGGYVNNNATMTARDWGGGGLFNANGSYLEIKNVLITENKAIGLGGGIGGCSTGDIHLAVTDGGALFDNEASGIHWCEGGEKYTEDKQAVEGKPQLNCGEGNLAQDYFCVHFSKVEAQMLGRGSCDWVGVCDDTLIQPPQRTVLIAQNVMGLTSTAMAPGKMEARMASRAYINGNFSNVHGGGIMCNGVLDVGRPMSAPLPAWLEVVGTKVFQSSVPMAEGMFSFEMLDASGNVVTTGTNGKDGTIVFGKQLVFETVGTFTYTIREAAGTDAEVQYDDTVYTMVVTTYTDTEGNICIDSVTINDAAIDGIEAGAFYVTLPKSKIRFVNIAKANLVIQAHKVWVDDNDRDGKRPLTIEVELYANGVATGKKLQLSNRNSTTDSNSWHGQFLNLNKYDESGAEIEYTVKEVSVPDGYTVAYSQDEDEKSLVITNTHIPETTEITATKVWQDNNDQDGIRPASVTLTLYANGTPYVDADGNGRTVTLSGDSNTWEATISGLPKYQNLGNGAEPIRYSFEETTVPAGYTKVNAGTTITNTHTPEEISISYQKTWVDNEDQDGKRPETITVKLYSGEGAAKKLVATQEAAAKDNYSGTFENLPKYAGGEEIVYTLEEVAVTGYITSISGSAADGFEITNTHEIEKTDLSVKKVWNDFNNQDGKRTAGIVVALYGNDKDTPITTATLNDSNGWAYTWEDLDLYAGGIYIDYSVVEIAYVDNSGAVINGVPDGYTPTHAYNNEKGSIIWTIATVTNTLTPERTTLNIQKEWDDNNNQDGIRPTSIELTLWKTTTKPTETITVNDHIHYVVHPGTEGWVKAVDSEGKEIVKTMTPTESGAWDADFENLPKYEAGKQIYYAVVETAINGYTPSYELAPGTNVLYIKNTHETEETEISVFKKWEDGNNQDGNRPASITVKLYGRDKTNPLDTITLPDANGNWSYTWTGLDKNYNGKAITYTVEETPVKDYNVDATGSAQGARGAAVDSKQITLTNTYVPKTTSISVIKEWKDHNNQDGKRPASITVELTADGEKTGKTLTLSADNNWRGTFSDLPVNHPKTSSTDVTKPISYAIWEDAIAAYNVNAEGIAQEQTVAVTNGVVVLSNTHTPEVVSVTAKKLWNDSDNQDGKRPASITLHLLADGEHTNLKAELKPDANGNWSYTWNNLPKYNDGKAIDYSIVEDHVKNGYSSSVDGYTVTNTYAPEKTFISVLKHWVDGNNQDNVRPESITVTLLANGQSTGKTLILNEANHWYGSFSDLEKFDNGVEINYTVQETAVEGYKAAVITGSMEDGFEITNERDVEKTEIKVSKVWDDANDQDGKRPASVTVTLYRDGVATDKTAELSTANNWTYTWTDLDVHHNKGETYTYKVVETVPEGYTAITTGNAAEGYVITNKHEPEITSIPVIKVWDDAQNQDGKRPESITVELLADNQSTGKTLTLSASVNWQGTFSDLSVYKAKTDSSLQTKAIVYTVKETAVAEYNVDANGTAQTLIVPVSKDGKVTITNTHEVEVTNLNVQKVWNDFNNKANMRPYAVVVALHENGKLSGNTLTLSSENGWKGAWENMPRYSGGSRIAYTVVETGFYRTEEDYKNGNLTTGVPSGYMVSHSYNSADKSNPVATVTNTYAPDAVGLNVQKRWDDDNNREGLRPTQIKVTLYHKIGEKGTWEVMEDSNGEPMTTVLTEENQWDADFLGLPKYLDGQLVYYNAVEEPVAGYEPTYKLDPATGVVTLTNTHSVNRNVKVSVSKVWDDGNDQDRIRPEEIVVTLYANGIKTSSTKTLNADNEWKAEWTGLYEYYKGSKIIYTVVEEKVPAGYKMKLTGDAATGFVITNTHEPETVEIPVSKVWDDKENQDGMRPKSITVTLLADGKATTNVLTLNAENLWKGSFTGLAKYADGVEIQYSVQEAVVEGYNLDSEGKAQAKTVPVVDGKVVITNVHAPEKTSLTAVKKWHDNDDQDGKRPDSITVHLLANGVHMGKEYTRVLNAENNWKCTWKNLDKYVSGQRVVYTVFEEPVEFKKSDIEAESEDTTVTTEKYITDYFRDSETKITINNRYAPETTQIKAIKVWEDDSNRDGLRTKTVKVKLLANGKDTGKVKTMKKANNWTVSWKDLPKYENHGELIEYTVKEVNVPKGYVCEITKHEEDENTYVLTNRHTSETTGVKVIKKWKDDNNNDGVRPDGLIVQLYADGTAVEGGRVILSDLNGWKHTFESTKEMPLYVYNNGELINYYVQEIGYVSDGVEYEGMPEGYKGKITQDEDSYDITITNTHASEKVKLTVNKIWDDGDNSDGVRPTKIKVTLLKNGDEVETVTLSKKNKWTHTWKNLYKYAGGVEVEYTVREKAVGDYTADYDYKISKDGKTITATVTNSYKPVGKWYAVKKVWEDNNNAEKLRPTSVKVQIYKNGEKYGDVIVLSAANKWQAPMRLPVYENGVAIEWTIKEVNIPKNYSVSYDQDTLTITNSIQSKEVPRTGDSNNLLMWFGLLGVCGTGAATVLFADKKKKRSK